MRRTMIGLVGAALLLGLLAPVAAQEEAESPVDETAGEKEKKGFWDRFPLYLELQVGQTSTERIGTTVVTTSSQIAESFLELDEQEQTRIVVGWTLPEDKGRFKLEFEGFRETSYTFNSQGLRLGFGNSNNLPPEPLPWWNVSIVDGRMVSRSQEPTWNDDGDGQVEDGEITYVSTPFGTTRDVTASLDNQIHVVDLAYERYFGGRRFGLIWDAGLRYFAYEGNLPATAWISQESLGNNGPYNGGYRGFTDGVLAPIISLNNESRGLGPTGSAIFLIKFFKERLALTLGVNAAFIVQSSDLVSTDFFAPVQNSSVNTIFQEPALVAEERNKDVWHTGAEAGIRLDLIPGLTLMASYFKQRYADALLLPTEFAVAESITQIGRGVTALYNTRDFNIEGWRAGIGFQF